MPFGQATVQPFFPGSVGPSPNAFVSAGTPMPGQNPAEGVTQALTETEAQYAAMLPAALSTISTATPTSTDFIVALPGGSTFDVTTFFEQYWWAVALGLVVLFWPSGKGRR